MPSNVSINGSVLTCFGQHFKISIAVGVDTTIVEFVWQLDRALDRDHAEGNVLLATDSLFID